MKRLLIALVVVLAACSGPTTYDTIDEAMQGVGCESGQVDDDPVTMFAAAEGYCDDGRQVVLFDTSEAQDNYVETARQFGFEPIEQGGNYVVYDERV